MVEAWKIRRRDTDFIINHKNRFSEDMLETFYRFTILHFTWDLYNDKCL